jgi:hypothetical protein
MLPIFAFLTGLFAVLWLYTRTHLLAKLRNEEFFKSDWERIAVHNKTVCENERIEYEKIYDQLRIERDQALQKLRKIQNLSK